MTSSLRAPGVQFLHSPGPTRLPQRVVDALGRQPLELGDPALDALIAHCEHGIRQLVGTQRADVFLYAANGHGAWEAAITNLVAPGQCVLVVGSGVFSDAWAEHTAALGVQVLRTPCGDGHAANAATLQQVLQDDRAQRIAAVFLVHTDTASGATSDLMAFRAAIDAARHPALLVVDAIASLGAEAYDMTACGIDVTISASQKALMLPPGLSFVVVNERAMAQSRDNPTPRMYWDWRRRQSPLSYRKFCGTPPQSLLMGLQASLELIFEEGLPQVIARHRRLAQATHAAVEGWSEAGALAFYVQDARARSASVTNIAMAAGIDAENLRTVARERFGVAISGGLGPLAGRVIRIGHLGDLNEAMLLGCLGGVEAAMRCCGIPYGRGLERAVDHLSTS